MSTLDEFVTLVRDETGLPVTVDDVGQHFDQLPGWDSVHLIALLVALERRTGRRVAMAEAMEASSLHSLYEAVAVGG